MQVCLSFANALSFSPVSTVHKNITGYRSKSEFSGTDYSMKKSFAKRFSAYSVVFGGTVCSRMQGGCQYPLVFKAYGKVTLFSESSSVLRLLRITCNKL